MKIFTNQEPENALVNIFKLRFPDCFEDFEKSLYEFCNSNFDLVVILVGSEGKMTLQEISELSSVPPIPLEHLNDIVASTLRSAIAKVMYWGFESSQNFCFWFFDSNLNFLGVLEIEKGYGSFSPTARLLDPDFSQVRKKHLG